MSYNDLRSSVRGALSHKLSRRDDSKPYLDKISVSKHIPAIGKNQWKKLLIQPISIPNLDHTGIQTAFEPPKEPFMKPDGSVNNAMRSTIKKQYTSLTREFQRMKKKAENNLHSDDDEDYDEDARVELQDTEESRSGPGPPNFENFLDFVYGPSNVAGKYRRNYEQQMRIYNPVEDEHNRRQKGRSKVGSKFQKKKRGIQPVSPQSKELYTTNMNYYTDSENMDEENEDTEAVLALYDESIKQSVDEDGNYIFR